MMRHPYRLIGVLILTLSTVLICWQGSAAARSQFGVAAQSATYNSSSGEVKFTLVFNQSPDFSTTDAFGRQKNSFQYFVIGDATLPYPSNFDSIIRGEEIHSSGLIPIRNAVPPDDSDPASGGWGTIRGEVPYTLRGRVLMFSAPLGLISDHVDAGAVAYHLETYEFGVLTGSVDGSVRLHR